MGAEGGCGGDGVAFYGLVGLEVGFGVWGGYGWFEEFRFLSIYSVVDYKIGAKVYSRVCDESVVQKPL